MDDTDPEPADRRSAQSGPSANGRHPDDGAPTEGDAAPEPAPIDPMSIRDPLPQPLFSVRRLVIFALVLVAFGFLAVGVRSGGGTGPAEGPAGIASFRPDPGGRVLRQSEIGVYLEPGYDGRLTINGVAIPEDQMAGAIDPASPAWLQLTDEERARGPRPNNKETVLFQPGPGKAVSSFDTGTVTVEVRYWRIAEGPQAASTFEFVVNVV